jgi:hypothetical protein
LKVTVVFTNPEGEYGEYLPFELSGESADPLEAEQKIHFSAEGSAVGSPMWQTVVATTTDGLPQQISHAPRTFSWKVRVPDIGPWRDLNDTTNPFWVTWHQPFGNPTITARRVDWVTDKADGCAGEASIGEAIWEALSGDPPLDPGEGTTQNASWYLLDGSPYYGWCNHQASLMQEVLAKLGVGSVTPYVYGSTADYDFTSPESRICPTHHDTEWLVLNNDGQYHSFAACCVVPDINGIWYCLYPVTYASSDWQMLWAVASSPNFQQWVKTNGPPPDEGVVLEFREIQPTPEP